MNWKRKFKTWLSMRNNSNHTLLAKTKSTLIFLICLISPVGICQNAVNKVLENQQMNDISADFSRFRTDSLFILTRIYDNQYNDIGFELTKSDLDFNMTNRKQYLSPELSGLSFSGLDSNSHIICCLREDSMQLIPFGIVPVTCLAVVKVDNNGDTLWTKSFCPNQFPVERIELYYAGHTNDTLLFYGGTSSSYELCGLIVYLNALNGDLINAFSYCDSTFGYSFRRGVMLQASNTLFLVGDRETHDQTSAVQTFFAELNYSGDIINSRLISDSADIGFIGCLIPSNQERLLMIGYRTYKYQTAIAASDFEMLILDSSRQAITCKYNPNFVPSTSLILKFGERIDSTSSFRLWSSRYFADLDDSLNLMGGRFLLTNFPANSYDFYKSKTYPDHIYCVGEMKATNFSNYESLLGKYDINGSGCYSQPITLAWNLLPGTISNTPISIYKAPFFGLDTAAFNLTVSQLTVQDTLYCQTTGVIDLLPEVSTPFIYPNPAEDFTIVKGINPGKFQLNIFDLSGQRVYSIQQVCSGVDAEFKIKLNDLLKPGTYLIQIIDSLHNSKTLKLSKL